MSVTSEALSIVSVGMSCQTTFQIDMLAGRFADITGRPGVSFGVSRLPLDWMITPPQAFCGLSHAGRFFPEGPDEIGCDGASPPYWIEHGCYFWHDFSAEGGLAWDIPGKFEQERQKYAHKAEKFHALAGRRVFVLSNTQNNLDAVAAGTGADFTLNAEKVAGVLAAIERFHPHGDNELIVVTSFDRITDDPAGWPVTPHFIDRTTRDPDDQIGDAEQWEAVFRRHFAARAARSGLSG